MHSLRMDPYVLDVLMPDLVGHDRKPAAFLVYLYLWRHSRETKGRLPRSLSDIAEGTGLSRRTVQSALKRLHARQLIRIRRESITAISEFEVHAARRHGGRT